jgi:DNA-binding beta-propeller fold protein YncE
VFLLASSTGRSQDNNGLAKRALALLEERCFSCHGQEGAAEGGLNFILNPPRLAARNIVVPGNALKSKLYRKVKSGDMPKDDDPLTPQEVELLRKWIDSDGSGFKPLPSKRQFISPANVMEFIQADLKKIDPDDQPYQRYFTITHLYNAGISDSELETYRRGLSKLINSLSWGKKIVRPAAIDPARTILRIDINDFLWTEETWDRILEENPYGVTYDTPTATYCYMTTGTEEPFVRADWFVAEASVPPLYHDILEMPTTDRELEKLLRVDFDRNLLTGRADRAGFTNSGVSQSNRLIERHPSIHGAYWKSYDFSANTGVQNLFARPLGPIGPKAFKHAGGEIIFNLPNGLQAYLLVDGKGNRIEKGPIEIVRDPKRPDSAVVNGLSCMSCHTRGMIFKNDQVRLAVLGNIAFPEAVRNDVKRLYPPKEDFRRLQEEDAKRFAEAVTETGGTVGTTEPILTLALRFEEELDLPLAAAEAGLPPADFLFRLKKLPRLAQRLAPLMSPGGTVKRDVYVVNFRSIVGPFWELASETLTLKGHTDQVYSVAFSPDGKQIASGSADETVRIWNAETGQELHKFAEHEATVSSVSFSPDGKRIVSGSSDMMVKVWDAESGKETLTFKGHSSSVHSVAFSPNGKRIVSGSADNTVKVWNAETGTQILELSNHSSTVLSVAFSPDGKRIVSGSRDNTVRIWNAETGEEIGELTATSGDVMSVAFSPDGKRIVSSHSAANSVIVWDIKTRKQLRTFKGHSGDVRSVSISPDGKRIVSSSSTVLVYEAETFEEIINLGGSSGLILSVAFSPDGKRIVSGSRGEAGKPGVIKVWDAPLIEAAAGN